jgi:hypothetical protein
VGQVSARPRKRRGTGLVTAAATALIAAVIIAVTLVELSSSGSVKSQLGSPTFLAGYSRIYAPQVAQSGPILLPDPYGKNRSVFLQHLGPDRKLGWVAIQAVPPGEAPKCILHWDQGAMVFRDQCANRTWPADGTGLIRYPVTVLPSDRIRLDLRTALPQDSTVTTGTAP